MSVEGHWSQLVYGRFRVLRNSKKGTASGNIPMSSWYSLVKASTFRVVLHGVEAGPLHTPLNHPVHSLPSRSSLCEENPPVASHHAGGGPLQRRNYHNAGPTRSRPYPTPRDRLDCHQTGSPTFHWQSPTTRTWDQPRGGPTEYPFLSSTFSCGTVLSTIAPSQNSRE